MRASPPSLCPCRSPLSRPHRLKNVKDRPQTEQDEQRGARSQDHALVDVAGEALPAEDCDARADGVAEDSAGADAEGVARHRQPFQQETP